MKVTFYISLIAYKLIKKLYIKENVPLKNAFLKKAFKKGFKHILPCKKIFRYSESRLM